MSTKITEVYEAFKTAGAPEDKAKAAAQSLAEQDNRFDTLDKELAILKAKLTMIQWTVGSIGFGILLLILKSLWPG